MLGFHDSAPSAGRRFWQHRAVRAALLILLCSSLPAAAGPLGTTCVTGPQPSASLLLPYFEVDLEDPAGRTTLISIGSRAEQPQVARVTLWTDWAFPTLSFDLLIPSLGIVPINLRDIFTSGTLPVATAGAVRPASCSDPLTQPAIDLEVLAAQHGGTEFPAGSGRCWASPREDSLLAGFLTVDALDDCSETIRYPTDEGYFATPMAEGLDLLPGIAAKDNVLFGDFFMVEPRQDYAQGAALVHLPADSEVVGEQTGSFYGFAGVPPTFDARRPLPFSYRTQYLDGGAFSGGTSLLLWHAPFEENGPVMCGDLPDGLSGAIGTGWSYLAREAGGDGGSSSGGVAPTAFARRAVVGVDFEVPGISGALSLAAETSCAICSPPFVSLEPSVVIPLFSAEGRFSVGLEAVATSDPCGADGAFGSGR